MFLWFYNRKRMTQIYIFVKYCAYVLKIIYVLFLSKLHFSETCESVVAVGKVLSISYLAYMSVVYADVLHLKII